MKRTWLAGAALAMMGTCALAQDEAPAPTAPLFSAEAFRSHVTFLADDVLEGRLPGTPGHEIAARYVAAQFTAAGLTPAGDNGTWFQRVPLREARLEEGKGALSIDGQRRAVGNGVLVRPSLLVEGHEEVTGDVVFAGHCLYEPKLKLDDFRGLDLKGKIVVCLPGFPKGLPSETAAHLTSERARFVAARGGIALISLWTRDYGKRFRFDRYTASAYTPRMQRMNPDQTVYQFAPGLRASGAIDTAVANALFAGSPKGFAAIDREGETRSVRGFALKHRMTIETDSVWRQITSPNVLGLVRGTDPKLAADIVVLGGHVDHLGVGTPVNGDAIYNGALDNAAGTATLIEVAKATAKSPPRRSVLFAAVTAEEKGLLGAEYFAMNPTVPKASMVAMIDLDMPVLLYDFTDVTAFGAEHSSLAEYVARAGTQMGVALAPDPVPEEVVFVRSDHYPFVQAGVPAVALATGYANGGAAAWKAFNETNYHQPSDESSLPIHWDQGARYAELNWRIMQEIANAEVPPRWYRGDYFGDAFAPGTVRAEQPATTK